MCRLFRSFALSCCIAAALGAEPGLPAHGGESSPATQRPSDWQEQRTLATGWQFVRGDLGGVWEALRSDERALQLPLWTAVTLPHCINATDSVDPEQPYYQGPSWYRTELDVANPFREGRTLLHFEGSGQKTTVWIGEQRVAEHTGGYDEFVVDITEAVAAYGSSSLTKLPPSEYRVTPGRVPLTVRCDNSRDLELMPSALSDFSRYGGLYRPVHLVYLPVHGLSRVQLTPERQADGSWRVGLQARFIASPGEAAEQTVSVRCVDPAGREVAAVQTRLQPSLSDVALPALVIREAQLWSPQAPALYGVEVVAAGAGGTSRVWQRFGLRWFEFVEKGPFKLNGERLLLRGTHRHEDHAGVAAAMTDEMMTAEMRLMKAMGANFIRLGHYQQSRRILELCDELGLLVWEEIPWCRGGLGGERYQEQGRAMLRAMIEQHANHPSVILWGLGNENDWPGDFPEFDREKIRTYMRELHELAHRLDPTRLTAIRRCDFCRDIPDVYSPSIWAGWYRGQFTEYAAVMKRERERTKRLVHAEWGGDSHAGRHAEDPYAPLREVKATGAADERGLDFMDVGGNARASRDGDWSESYLCDLVDWHLKEQEKMDWFAGAAMWPFKDFSTPLRPENPVPFVNQKGAVERDLTPKESFYVYQSYWTEEPMIRIYGHSWPVRWGAAGEARRVHVYSNCAEAELWLNGVSQGVRRRDSQDFPAAGLRWDVVFVDGMNQVHAVGRSHGREVSDEIALRYETRSWGPPHHLRLQEFAAPHGRAVQVELLDAAGVVCLDARPFVRFGRAGDGRLRDNLGTAGGSRQVQLANGRARIEVDLPPGGRAVVSAAIAGVPTALIEVREPTTDAAALRAKPAEARLAEVAAIERERVRRLAMEAMAAAPVSLRSAATPPHAIAAGVQPGDFYSMGDYWWPNPASTNGLPYVRRDGQSNPENFTAHRLLLREVRDRVAALGAAYVIDGQAAHAQHAAEWLRVFFVDPSTRMNPHLRLAQAIPGVTTGRGIGLIDTLHLVEIPLALEAIERASGVDPVVVAGVRAWFAAYLQWMRESPPGREEAAANNNHSVAYWLQVAVFARGTGNEPALAAARRFYRETLLVEQLAPDGSFPRELARTKPYGYSIFQLDNVALLTDVLSTPADNLWDFALPDGRGIAAAVAFLAPYLVDRSAWPFAADVEHFSAWPVRSSALLLAGYELGRPDYLALWQALPADSANFEVRRNLAVTQPLLWLRK